MNPSELERGSEPLTREQVLAMPAGKALGRLVAERVMGWALCEDSLRNPQFDTHVPWTTKHGIGGMEPWRSEWGEPPTYKVFTSQWEPSTDIAAAWQAVEKLVHQKWPVEVAWPAPGGFACSIRGIYAIGNGETAPLAICRAALLTTLEP